MKLIKNIKMKVLRLKSLLLVLVFIFGIKTTATACSPLNIPTIVNWSIVGNNLVINASSNTIYNCNGYYIQVELICNSKNFTGNAPFFYTSPTINKTSTPFAFPTMNIPIGSLCAGTQYKFRIREGYGAATFSGWTVTNTFITPGNFVQPVLNVTASPNTVCFPQTSQLTASLVNGCGGGPITYSWVPATFLSCTTCSNPIASPTITTTWTVYAMGGPTACWSASNVVTVVANTIPPSVGTVTAPASVCYGTSATVAISSFSGSLQWKTGPSATGPWVNTAAVNASVIVTPTLSTMACYMASVTGCGNALTSNTVCININPSPTITVNSANICQGFSTTLTAGGASSYTWSAGATSISANSASVAPLVTTAYTVTGSQLGCTSYAVANVTVNPTPTLSTSNVNICVAQNLSLTVNSVPGATFAWSGPQSFTSTQQNPVIINAQANMSGQYTVVATSTAGCTQFTVANVLVTPLPTITVVGNQTVCSQNFNNSTNTVVLTANGAAGYTWTIPTGYSAPSLNGSNITITPIVTSVPAVATVSVIGATGACSNSATYNINVIPNPTIATVSSSMCAGTSASMSASGASSFTWSPSNTLSSNIGASVIGNPTVTTLYSIVGSSLGCNSATQNASITVVANPTVFISPYIPPICAGTSTVLTANGANSYTWILGSSQNTTTGNFIAITPSITTYYTLIGEASTCTATAMMGVTVIPLPSLQAACSNTAICSGQSTNINANGATSYTWSPSTGVSDAHSNFVTVKPPVSIVYTLIGNNGICTASLSVPINVILSPNLELTINPTRICQGNSTTIYASGANNYQWYPGSSLSSTNTSFAIANPSATTNYTVWGVNSSGTVVCTMAKEITVEVVQQVVATVGNSVVLCSGESARLNASGRNTYKWLPKEGLDDNTLSNPLATPKTSTIYTVTVSDYGYCGATATVFVKVNPTPTVSAGANAVFNSDEPMYIEAKGTGTLTWIDGVGILCKACPVTQVMPPNSSCYRVQAVNDFGCKAIDEVCIEVTNEYNLYIPNIFTPNFDGVNDVFKVHGTGITQMELIIFDRWGEQLYSTTDPDKGWDGMYNGKLSKNDAYVYLVKFTTLGGKKHTKSGHVSLLK